MSEAENHTARERASQPPRTLDEILQSSEGLTFTEPNALPMPQQSEKPRRGYHATPVALDDELPEPVRLSRTARVRQSTDWSFIGKLLATGLLQLVALAGAYLIWRHSRVAYPQVPYPSRANPQVYVMRTLLPVFALWNMATVLVLATPSLLLSAWDKERQREWIALAAVIATVAAFAIAFVRFSGH